MCRIVHILYTGLCIIIHTVLYTYMWYSDQGRIKGLPRPDWPARPCHPQGHNETFSNNCFLSIADNLHKGNTKRCSDVGWGITLSVKQTTRDVSPRIWGAVGAWGAVAPMVIRHWHWLHLETVPPRRPAVALTALGDGATAAAGGGTDCAWRRRHRDGRRDVGRSPLLLVLVHAVAAGPDRDDEQQPADDGQRLEEVVLEEVAHRPTRRHHPPGVQVDVEHAEVRDEREAGDARLVADGDQHDERDAEQRLERLQRRQLEAQQRAEHEDEQEAAGQLEVGARRRLAHRRQPGEQAAPLRLALGQQQQHPARQRQVPEHTQRSERCHSTRVNMITGCAPPPCSRPAAAAPRPPAPGSWTHTAVRASSFYACEHDNRLRPSALLSASSTPPASARFLNTHSGQSVVILRVWTW